MDKGIPAWALRRAGPGDREAARDAQGRGTLRITWPDLGALRGWARQQGWPAPRLGFQAAFTAALFANDENFALALSASGIELQLPQQRCLISGEQLGELDALYAARSASGRPTDWGSLVAALREMRRAVEAGVTLDVEAGPALQTWQGFYEWAHGRYHMLEDGYDQWIGDDRA
jgi:hypothetical protein